MNCNKELTYIYSSPCLSYLRELIDTLNPTFSVKDKIDDMFWYGVFCKPETYSNYREYDRCDCEVPEILTNEKVTQYERLSFIKSEMDKVIRGEKEKPGYFFFVEEYEAFNEYEDSPSTFLYLIPKEERYRKFGEALTNFLYSPNLMVTLKN